MRVPDLVYTYAALKDTAGGTLELWFRRFDFSNSNDTFTEEMFSVPADKILVLSSIAGSFTPPSDGPATLTNIRIETSVEGLVGFVLTQFRTYALVNSADEGVAMNWSGEVWVPPDGTFQCRVVKTGGVNNTNCAVSAHGFLIPRGNIQRG